MTWSNTWDETSLKGPPWILDTHLIFKTICILRPSRSILTKQKISIDQIPHKEPPSAYHLSVSKVCKSICIVLFFVTCTRRSQSGSLVSCSDRTSKQNHLCGQEQHADRFFYITVLNYDIRRLASDYCLHNVIVVFEACITMALLYPAWLYKLPACMSACCTTY